MENLNFNETTSWSLRKEIMNFDEALTAFDRMSTDADIPHVYFSLCLASWVSDINGLVREYVADLDSGECDEVLGIDFQTMTKKEYWLKSGKLESYLTSMNGKPLRDYLSSKLFDTKAEMTTDDIFRSIDEGVSEMVELLKEVKKKTMEAPPEFYENFYHRMMARQNLEAVTLMLMVVQMLRVSVLVRIIGRGVVRPTGKEVYRQACPAWNLYPERKEDHD